ncbi:aryl carrier-like protein [Bradyrhizobium sp. GM2.4]
MPEPGVLLLSFSLGIARGLTRGRALWLRLVHGLRTLLVPRLLFTALISDDALVGMGHDSSRLFAVSKRLRAGASKVPTREIRLLTVR